MKTSRHGQAGDDRGPGQSADIFSYVPSAAATFAPDRTSPFAIQPGALLSHADIVAPDDSTVPPTGLFPHSEGPPPPSHGLIINLQFDSQALAAPQSFRDGMQQAANLLEAAFSDSITINIAVGYGEILGMALPSQNTSEGGATGFGIDYASLRQALALNATSANDTTSVASLPVATSLEGQSTFFIPSGEEKALGLIGADGTSTDGEVGMGTGFTGNTLVAAALHEITHAMGRIAGYALDLFRFNENGTDTRVFGGNIPATPAYFSINGGHTDIADFGINSDPGDFLNSSSRTPNDPFNEIVGSISTLTAIDLEIMDVLGFHLASVATKPDLTVSSLALQDGSLSFAVSNTGTAQAGPSTTSVYASTDKTITSSDTPLAAFATASLAARATAFGGGSFTIPGSLQAGTYFVGALADSAGAISELNETNNVSNLVTLILGSAGADHLTGTQGAEAIYALAGDDTISMGANFVATDAIDGGAGNDTLVLNGDYSTTRTFTASTMTSVETIVLTAGHTYSLATNDATVGSGKSLRVDGSALGAADSLRFNGATELDGTFKLVGGKGNDVVTGGVGNDNLNMAQGGNDTVNGGAGKDTIAFGATFASGDVVDGGAGKDTLSLSGDYSAGLTITDSMLKNVETISLKAGFGYHLKTGDGVVAAGSTLTIDASALGASDSFVFNGSGETDGHFVLLSGLGADTLRGGAQSDTFGFGTAADSTGPGYDTIQGVNWASDKVKLPASAGKITAIDAAVGAGTLDSGTNLNSELTTAMTGHLGAHHAVLFSVNAGTLHGQVFLVVDLNGTAGYQAGADLVLHLTNPTGTLGTADFV